MKNLLKNLFKGQFFISVALKGQNRQKTYFGLRLNSYILCLLPTGYYLLSNGQYPKHWKLQWKESFWNIIYKLQVHK